MICCTKPSVLEHGVPRRGYVLSTAVEKIANDARKIVRLIALAISECEDIGRTYSQNCEEIGAERAAWHALTAWILWYKFTQSQSAIQLANAQQWYIGRPHTAKEKRFWRNLAHEVEPLLSSIANRDGILELLPYVLESHGPGSRLSVLRDPSTQIARTRKKDSGIFYTPPDVASYMAGETLLGHGSHLKILDPAAGTGVFLRAALAQLRVKDQSRNAYCLALDTLYGCDIDAQSLDGAALVILADVLPDAMEVAATPLAAWKALRTNLRQCDATLIDPALPSTSERLSLQDIFPAVSKGFDVIIGNPPYADIGMRHDLAAMAERFQSIKACPKRTADLYTVFVEQMVRLSSEKASGAMVLPLSLACNSGPQFRACREAIEAQPGHWRFAFFDRQPHALFGEDVKTRNTILFWSRQDSGTKISTGPLRRWRGDDRREMFKCIDFTSIKKGIATGIPKLHGPAQAAVWNSLRDFPDTLSDLITDSSRTVLCDLPAGSSCEVFVAPTAYNFLGVARPCSLNKNRNEELSSNPMIRLKFRSEELAAAAYATLSGYFAFWWWHVTGDGFHVNQKTLGSIPIGQVVRSKEISSQLASLGRDLWKITKKVPVRSVNRGRVSYAFSSKSAPDIRRQIDILLLRALEIPEDFIVDLEEFTETITEAQLFTRLRESNKGNIGMKQKKISTEIKERSKVTKEEWREYTKTVWSIANKARPDHPAAFPEEIPHRLTKLFSFYGDTVLDPFAGTGSTARASIPLGRKTVCVEQNSDYAAIIRSECAKLRNGHAEDFVPLEVINGDSRNMEFLENDSVGLIVTSPPYWDKADYGTGENNLGNIASYKEFLESIRPVFEECYRVLEPGRKMCVVTANVNQHTEEGLLTFPLATDFGVILRNIGFVMVNEIIWSKDRTGGKWGSFGAQRPIFGSYPYPPNFLFKNIHEYILIFAKPALTKRKGPKVKKYNELMGGIQNSQPLMSTEIDDEHALMHTN